MMLSGSPLSGSPLSGTPKAPLAPPAQPAEGDGSQLPHARPAEARADAPAAGDAEGTETAEGGGE